MKFCSKCGAQLADDAAFCPKCGTPCPTSPAQPEPTFSAPAPLDVPPEDLLSSESLPPLEGESEVMPTGEAAPAAGKKSFLDSIKAWSKKKKIIAGSVAALLVVAAVASFALLYKSEFEQVSDECVQIAGMITGDGKTYFSLDTYPDEYANMDPDVAALLQSGTQEKVLKAIKHANTALGFDSGLYDQMLKTNALMGRQTEENDKYKVAWSYHPDDGLEVTYSKK